MEHCWKQEYFLEFAKDWKFLFATSSPYHSEGNEKAESTVEIAKKLCWKRLITKNLLKSLLLQRNKRNKIGSSP